VWDSQWELAVHFALWDNQWEVTYCLAFPSCFLQNQKFRQYDCSASYLLRAGFLLGSFFDPEDRGDMFPRNVA
jgi:hypothetical protein